MPDSLMPDSLMDITLTSNYTSLCESDGQGGTVYIIDGKVWRIGEHKISKWSKAKCNKIIKDNGNDNQPIDPQDSSSH